MTTRGRPANANTSICATRVRWPRALRVAIIVGPLSVSAAPPRDTAAELETLLKVCRQYGSPENGQVNWARAKEACDKALDLEPIHAEANELSRQLRKYQACEQTLTQANALAASNRAESALAEFEKLTPDCGTYFLKALDAVKAPAADVKKAAAADCKRYIDGASWPAAAQRCEVYARIACQSLEPSEYTPPRGALNAWKSKDPVFSSLHRARTRLSPPATVWTCPTIAVLRGPKAPEDPAVAFKAVMAGWYADKEFSRALTLYFDGRLLEMKAPLQKVIETVSKAALHEQARALLLDLSNAVSAYESGVSAAQNDKLEQAAEFFAKALAIDDSLLLQDTKKPSDFERKRLLEGRASFVRRAITDTMGSVGMRRGVTFARRHNFTDACKAWKLGLSFAPTNLDLLTAVNDKCLSK